MCPSATTTTSIFLALEDFNNWDPSVVAEPNRAKYSNENFPAYFSLHEDENSTSSVVFDLESYDQLLEVFKKIPIIYAILGPIHNDVGLKLPVAPSQIDMPIRSPAIIIFVLVLDVCN